MDQPRRTRTCRSGSKTCGLSGGSPAGVGGPNPAQSGAVDPTRSKAGFSLVEALVATAVLGIGLAALTNAHLTSIRGVDNSADAMEAQSLARAIADDIQIGQYQQNGLVIPLGCTNLGGTPGCKTPNGDGFTADLGVCSRYFTGAASPVPPPPGPTGGFGNLFMDSNPNNNGNERFRVDVTLASHNDPSIPATDAAVLTVSACWRDPLAPGRVRQVQETRVLNWSL